MMMLDTTMSTIELDEHEYAVDIVDGDAVSRYKWQATLDGYGVGSAAPEAADLGLVQQIEASSALIRVSMSRTGDTPSQARDNLLKAMAEAGLAL